MLVTESSTVSKISVQCIESLSIPSERARRVVLGTLIVDFGDAFVDEDGTIVLEYDAEFSIRKYSVLEFLQL